MANNRRIVKSGGIEPLILIAAIALVFGYLGNVMGTANMLRTMIATAYDLIINTGWDALSVCRLCASYLIRIGGAAFEERMSGRLAGMFSGLPLYIALFSRHLPPVSARIRTCAAGHWVL